MVDGLGNLAIQMGILMGSSVVAINIKDDFSRSNHLGSKVFLTRL